MHEQSGERWSPVDTVDRHAGPVAQGLPTAPAPLPPGVRDLRIALVHYWLVRARGGEKVLEQIVQALGPTDIFTNVHAAGYRPDWLEPCTVRTTFINKVPGAARFLTALLPLMPAALGALNMDGYDLVISSEAGPAKWIVPSPEATHICYVHSPMRYIWDQMHNYLHKLPAPARLAAYVAADRMRVSDVTSAQRVDHFVANSSFVAQRVNRYYRRDARVIHPPVNIPAALTPAPVEDFYLCAGQLVPYKRVELAIQACARLNRRLVVTGAGPEMKYLRRIAGPNVEFRGFVPEDELRGLFRSCRALLFPGVEDFGITPVEVMGEGRPVIAFGRGGALDYVAEGVSGILFRDESVAGMERAILAFEAEEGHFDSRAIHAHAAQFDASVFRAKFVALIEEVTRGR